VILALLDAGADIEYKTPHFRFTHCYFACNYGVSAFQLQLLIDRGADFKALTWDDESPLFACARLTNPERAVPLIRVLLRTGLKVQLKFNKGINVFDQNITAEARAELYKGVSYSVILMLCGMQWKWNAPVRPRARHLRGLDLGRQSQRAAILRVPKDLMREAGRFVVG
jgi:hypothetical protein